MKRTTVLAAWITVVALMMFNDSIIDISNILQHLHLYQMFYYV
jgi:hypothetical protein